MTWRLIALITIPTLIGLTFGALRVAAANGSADQFSQVTQLALLGQQVTGLAQALEDERDLTAGYIAAGRPSPGLAGLRKQYAVTDAWGARVRSLSAGIGSSYPVAAQDKVNVVLARLSDLPGLRLTAQGSGSASPLIIEYSAAVGDLLSFNDEIAEGSANSALADTVRTLSSLSRMKNDVSQQRAILYAALIEGQFELGAPDQLTAAQAQQAADLSQFQTSATLAQQQLFSNALPGQATDQDQVLEQLAIDAGNPQQVDVSPGQWYTSMSSTVNRLRTVEEQLASSVVSQSQALQRGAGGAAVLTGLLSLALLLIAAIGTFIVARSMVRPLRVLRSDALEIAGMRLPEKVHELADAEDPPASVDVVPVSVHSVDEIGQVARAFDQVHREAVRLAGNEAMLRNNMNAMFVSLSRRNQSLLERLVRLIDSQEQGEDDPDRLSNLFTMDHLVTRMRRHSENLLVLAGHEPARKWAEPVALADLVRAAVSEILEYNRVVANVQPGVAVLGQAVNDIVHLLAEIIENATLFSSRDSQVEVSGRLLNSGGVLIEVTDTGVGIPAERLAQLNWRLDNPPVADVSVSRHMGLFAVSHLAARHGVRVRLQQASPRGMTALVWIPQILVTKEGGNAGWAGAQAASAPRTDAAAGGWSAFGRNRSIRRAILSGTGGKDEQNGRDGPNGRDAAEPDSDSLVTAPAAAHTAPAAPAALPERSGAGRHEEPEAEPIYELMASEWFRGPVPAQGTGTPEQPGVAAQAAWESPADAGWRAAESAATPVRGQLTAAGLPQRIPRANIVPGSAPGIRRAPAAATATASTGASTGATAGATARARPARFAAAEAAPAVSAPAEPGTWGSAGYGGVAGEGEAAGGTVPRVPPAHLLPPGSLGSPGPSGPAPAVPRRSPDKIRARLAGLQRGTRRAESVAGTRAGRPADDDA
ncbi:MAG: sensor histidine kinase [Streptosporangiaceae bacterium]|nr:sensor histidine kinase [Streptosporangiaceae bacterium]MBV9853378.1 sensor histidine kinase [Streptosporangiaceae bacterium]